MKKLLFALAILAAFALNAKAQEEFEPEKKDELKTLVTKDTKVGFSFALDNNFATINNDQAYFSGGRLGFTFNRYLFVGVGGYGLANGVTLKDWLFDDDLILDAGYGGLSIEPTIFPRQPIHVTFPLFVGGGAAAYRERYTSNWFDTDAFWVFQGGAQLEFNVTKWLRLAGGAHYVETHDLELPNTSKSLLEGLQYGVSLKIGSF